MCNTKDNTIRTIVKHITAEQANAISKNLTTALLFCSQTNWVEAFEKYKLFCVSSKLFVDLREDFLTEIRDEYSRKIQVLQEDNAEFFYD